MSQVEHDVDEADEETDDNEDKVEYVAVEDEPDGKQDDGESKEGDEEQRLGGGREEDDDTEGKKAKRPLSRKQRQRKARERTDRELQFLRNRNEQLERQFSEHAAAVDARVTGSELTSIEQGITKAKSDLQLADSVLSQAVEKGDGAAYAEAMAHRDTIRDNLHELGQHKDYITAQNARGSDTGREVQPRPLDPRHRAHADKFIRDHDWWDSNGGDKDSQTVLDLDEAVKKEGYDPTSKDYWEELDARVREALPHHYEELDGEADDDEEEEDEDPKPKPKAKAKAKAKSKGPTFRTGGRERPLKRNEVHISAERKEAMIEAGVWDDPVQRRRFLKSYKEYDEAAGLET